MKFERTMNYREQIMNEESTYLRMLIDNHTASDLIDMMEISSEDLVQAFQYELLNDDKYEMLRQYIDDLMEDSYND